MQSDENQISINFTPNSLKFDFVQTAWVQAQIHNFKKIEIINVGPPINVPYEGVSCDVNCSSVIYYTSSYQLIFYSITHTHPFNSSVWDYPG